jgi:hypothetical protein
MHAPKLQNLLLAPIFLFAFAQSVSAIDPDFGRFIGTKLSETRATADAQTNKVPSFVWSFFDAIRRDDWETATNLAQRIEMASGRFYSTNHEAISPGLQSVIWPPISESIGAYVQFHNWNAKWLHRFGTNIIDSIPSGSVYFGGTDPGRYIISALMESQRAGRPFFILTQNQLVDSAYLEYSRAVYGHKIYIPSTNDLQKAFEDYLEDAQRRLRAGNLKPGEDVTTNSDGHAEAHGEVSVMEINALLAKIVLERNPTRNFYIEESYALDWMYPQLSPHGLIMELHHKPLSGLDRQTVEKDMDFWKRLTGDALGSGLSETNSVHALCDFCERVYLRKDLANFKGDVDFAKDEEAQKTFSKLRSSIGGLYVWRAEHATSDDERESMRKAADTAFRQAFLLCPYSPEVIYRYTRFLVELNRPNDALLISETCLRMGHPETEQYLRGLIRWLHQTN